MRILEGLIAGLRERCAGLPDRRTGSNIRYAMADIGLAAFSVFFMQSPSLLAHQRVLAARCGRSNAETLFGMTAIPFDNHIRQMLDGVPAGHFDPVFAKIVAAVGESGGLKPLRRLDSRVLVEMQSRLAGERGLRVSIGAVWRLLARRRITRKKSRRTQPSRIGPTS